MVLFDMKKLGHQCCLFIVTNLATCFASAVGELAWTPSRCLPSLTCYIFMRRASTENQAMSGQVYRRYKLARKASGGCLALL